MTDEADRRDKRAGRRKAQAAKGETGPRAPRGEKGRARSAARLAAVQALYQMELAGQGVEAVIAEFRADRLGMEIDGARFHDADADLFVNIARGVVERQVAIDRAVDALLAADWPLARLDAILRAVLRAGAYELLARPDVPARVAVSEYVDIATAFLDQAETSFANGVLDRLARQVRLSEFEPAA